MIKDSCKELSPANRSKILKYKINEYEQALILAQFAKFIITMNLPSSLQELFYSLIKIQLITMSNYDLQRSLIIQLPGRQHGAVVGKRPLLWRVASNFGVCTFTSIQPQRGLGPTLVIDYVLRSYIHNQGKNHN